MNERPDNGRASPAAAKSTRGFWRLEHGDLKALLRHGDLSWGDARVLLALGDLTLGRGRPEAAISLTDLAHFAGFTDFRDFKNPKLRRGHVARALGRLRAAGFVRQRPGPGRSVLRSVDFVRLHATHPGSTAAAARVGSSPAIKPGSSPAAKAGSERATQHGSPRQDSRLRKKGEEPSPPSSRAAGDNGQVREVDAAVISAAFPAGPSDRQRAAMLNSLAQARTRGATQAALLLCVRDGEDLAPWQAVRRAGSRAHADRRRREAEDHAARSAAAAAPPAAPEPTSPRLAELAARLRHLGAGDGVRLVVHSADGAEVGVVVSAGDGGIQLRRWRANDLGRTAGILTTVRTSEQVDVWRWVDITAGGAAPTGGFPHPPAAPLAAAATGESATAAM